MSETFLTQIRFKDQMPHKHCSKDRLFNRSHQKERRWQNLLRKISFEPENEEFYKDYPIKPGFHLWKTLTTCDLNPKLLKGVRIPSSFVVLGNNNHFWLQYNAEKDCIIRKSELQSTINDFEASISSEKSKCSNCRILLCD